MTSLEPPLWVILPAASAITLGTAAGGWRIIKTMGNKVVKLDPVHGFAAETIGGQRHPGRVLPRRAGQHHAGHLRAIIGVGSSDRLKQVRWSVARSIVIAWFLTLPASGTAAALAYLVLNPFLS